MKLLLSGLATAAALMAMVDFGNATPVRLDRRGPVTNVVTKVVNTVTNNYSAQKQPGSTVSHADERQVLCLVNKERTRAGLKPLTLHPAVTKAAYEHSVYQSRVKAMTHANTQNGSLGDRLKKNGFKYTSAAENIAEAPKASPKDIFKMWKDDPPHYKNIMDPSATYMGLACVNGFWTQDFGSSSDYHAVPQYFTQDKC
ncbi:hypothetical protein GGI12_001834 [Dipsacomyces acuminosporus]|nr:hypothetical protein GGI12_001834 [Dipsacomyces acuminosporus]